MKRLFFIILLALAVPAGAQDNRPTTVLGVRQKYSDIQKFIAMMDQEEHTRSQITLYLQRNVPGIGIQKETVTCFYEYSRSDDENEWNFFYRPIFITVKFNVAVHQCYQEYLFDVDSGKPVFVFLQQDSYLSEEKDETRYYFGPSGLISEIVKGERIMDQQEAFDKGASLWTTMLKNMNSL